PLAARDQAGACEYDAEADPHELRPERREEADGRALIRAREGIGTAGSFAERDRAGNAERDPGGDVHDIEHERGESAGAEGDGSGRRGAGDRDRGKEWEGHRRPQSLDRFIREADRGLHDRGDEETGADTRDRRPYDGLGP